MRRRATITTALLLAVTGAGGVLTPVRVGAQGGTGDLPVADRLSRDAADRLRALHEEADQLVGEARGVLSRLRALELERRIASEELRQAEAAAARAAQELADVEGKVEHLQRARDRETPRVRARFVELYKLGRGRYARLLFATTDVRRFGQAARAAATVAARDAARVRAYETQLREIEAARARAESQRQVLDARRAEATRAHAGLNRAIAAQAALVRDIDGRRDLNAQLVGELQAAQERLEATLVRAEGAPVAGLPLTPFRGVLPWPADGRPRPVGLDPLSTGRPGLEVHAPEGAPVRAVHAGAVAFAGSFEGLGNLVVIDHGDQAYSLYGHLFELAVGRGVAVVAGQAIGTVGTSPTGQPGLYFELRVAGRPVDPLLWLTRAR